MRTKLQQQSAEIHHQQHSLNSGSGCSQSMPPKILDSRLRPTIKTEDAVFSEIGRILSACKAQLYGEVEEMYRNDPGNGFGQFVTAEMLMLHNKQWRRAMTEEGVPHSGILFTRQERGTTSWVAKLDGYTIRILATCDIRDASQWVGVFQEVVNSGRTLVSQIINLLANTEFVLGTHDGNPLNIAGAGTRTIHFFNHCETGRLFACGVETATRKWQYPTSIRNFIMHECAHLFQPSLQEEIDRTSDVVFDAFSDNEVAKAIVMETALAINSDYLLHLFEENYAKCTVPNYKNQETVAFDASRTSLATHCAQEIVTQAFSRYVFNNEVMRKLPTGAYAQNLINRLRNIAQKPIGLPKAGVDSLHSKTQAPVSLNEALTNSLRRRKDRFS